MQKTWLLTAFEKYKDGDSTRANTADISEEDDTAGFLSIPNKNIPQPKNNAISPSGCKYLSYSSVITK